MVTTEGTGSQGSLETSEKNIEEAAHREFRGLLHNCLILPWNGV